MKEYTFEQYKEIAIFLLLLVILKWTFHFLNNQDYKKIITFKGATIINVFKREEYFMVIEVKRFIGKKEIEVKCSKDIFDERELWIGITGAVRVLNLTQKVYLPINAEMGESLDE